MTQAINSSQALYRLLPAMDSLLLLPAVVGLSHDYGKTWTKKQLTLLLNQARTHIHHQHELPEWAHHSDLIVEKLTQKLCKSKQHSLQAVINLSGTLLHTNLGRSQLCDDAIDAVTQVMRHPIGLEFDMGTGKRGHRDNAISELIHELTHAESCCLVNNNAAAVLLMLSVVAAGKEVIVSRGELVEIGGAFRIPDIMALAGCKLVEVGCTNRTHLADYERAITDNTAAIMKVHTSNYHIVGFSSTVDENELAALCKQHHIAMISDLGSGALTDLSQFGLSIEPMPQQMIKKGVDLISFSGDKLLGGPQAGIVVGKKSLINQLQSHPLKRALRCDKMTLAALEATLRQYCHPEKIAESIPTFKKLSRHIDELSRLAQELEPYCYGISSYYDVDIKPCKTQVGSGSQPHMLLDSMAICFSEKSVQWPIKLLDKYCKSLAKPIIGRMQNGRLWFDLRGVDNADELQQILASIIL